jgi:hypothetical protein
MDIAFELKGITDAIAVADYQKLRAISKEEIKFRSNIGSKAMDYFTFTARLRTKTKSGYTFIEWIGCPQADNTYVRSLVNNKIENGYSVLQGYYTAFQMYSRSGSIGAFKPLIAKYLYTLYNPKCILDFCAGWGGRCLGAMACDIDYIGFDTNHSMKEDYEKMIAKYEHSSKVSMQYIDSSTVDFKQYEYDMVFTSPPYFINGKSTQEQYENMPTYTSREEFNDKFLFKAIRNAWNGMAVGGRFCLNISPKMYNDAKSVLGSADVELDIGFGNRHKNPLTGKCSSYTELIYVWNKKNMLCIC